MGVQMSFLYDYLVSEDSFRTFRKYCVFRAQVFWVEFYPRVLDWLIQILLKVIELLTFFGSLLPAFCSWNRQFFWIALCILYYVPIRLLFCWIFSVLKSQKPRHICLLRGLPADTLHSRFFSPPDYVPPSGATSQTATRRSTIGNRSVWFSVDVPYSEICAQNSLLSSLFYINYLDIFSIDWGSYIPVSLLL